MKLITAKIIDPTHLELQEPIPTQPGKLIRISIPEKGEDELLWQQAAKKRFFEAYHDEDAIYDQL